MRTAPVAFALSLALSMPALAAAKGTQEFQVDPVHSQVGFTVKHLVSKVPGTFNEFTGTVRLDPANVAKTLEVAGTVQAASVDTRNDKRDGHLRSPDFFDAENHPEISFVSTGVKAKGKDTFEVSGNLTIRGVTKPVTLEAEWFGVVTSPWGAPTTGLDLTGTIQRKDFGIVWNKALDAGGVLLGEDVKLEVHLEAAIPKADG